MGLPEILGVGNRTRATVPIPSHRPLLIFKHNAKAGGGSTMKLLTEMKNVTFPLNRLKDSPGCLRVARGLPKKMTKRNREFMSTHGKPHPKREINARYSMRKRTIMRNHRLLAADNDPSDEEYDDEEPLSFENENGDHQGEMQDEELCSETYGCKDPSDCKYSVSDLVNRTNAIVYISEFERVGRTHQRDGFVISAMREPCDHFLSLWAYGSAKQGSLYNEYKKTEWSQKAYGQDGPKFDSERDIHAFRRVWLKDRRIRGLIARRHSKSYGVKDRYTSQTPKTSEIEHMDHLSVYSVDCWVYIDDYEATLYSCLRQYEAQGGLVDWDAPLLSELTRGLQDRLYPGRRLQSTSDTAINETTTKDTDYTKNDPLHNIQNDHHARCAKYYDNETARYVTSGRERIIFEHFGYDGCCGDRVRKNTLILPPPPSEGVSSHTITPLNGKVRTPAEEVYFDPVYEYLFNALGFVCVGFALYFMKYTRFGSCWRGPGFLNRRKEIQRR